MENVIICSRCVMDSTADGFFLDSDGVCNYCTDFLNEAGHIIFEDSAKRDNRLHAFVDELMIRGKKNKYDCIVGVSGGVDSSWVLVKAVQLGLRPLAVHMDNGWNSELAQNNISNLVQVLGVDLYTYVIDWNEYKGLMQSFFDADVIDIELLYDNAMWAVNFNLAKKFGIKYILAGQNHATEGMRMPENWNWFKFDKKNIRHISSVFTKTKLITFPAIGTLGFIYRKYISGIKWVPFLDYFDYNKQEVLDQLVKSYGYKPYPYKHYESIFTRFYQGYILPNKFKVDKRKLHLSTLIISGQLTRDDALQDLKKIPYPSLQDLNSDIYYFLKKMDWSDGDLSEYISRSPKPHSYYKTEKPFFEIFHAILRFLKKCRK